MTTGAGFGSAGSAPAGLGTPTENTQLYVDSLKRSVGGCVSSVQINGRTGDFEVDDYGSEELMSDASQRVYCLLKRDFEPPDVMVSNLKEEIEVRVRDALAPAIADGSITLDSVDVDKDVTKALAVIWWTDTKNRKSDRMDLPLRQ